MVYFVFFETRGLHCKRFPTQTRAIEKLPTVDVFSLFMYELGHLGQFFHITYEMVPPVML